ncbi:MAG TPA: phospholipase domain-containing protein, partial [Fodinibius sp.]|nr:phospholipase domain-containing protein [Fodinibius sp.]
KDFIQKVNNARFKDLPTGYREYSTKEVEKMAQKNNPLKEHQEAGSRPSCALPYQLYVKESTNSEVVKLQMEASNEFFGNEAAGSPFTVYAPSGYQKQESNGYEKMCSWNYAVNAGEHVEDSWRLHHFSNSHYHLELYGPNGFFRGYRGGTKDPAIEITLIYERITSDNKQPTGNAILQLLNASDQKKNINLYDEGYDMADHNLTLTPGEKEAIVVPSNKNYGWYDLSLKVKGYPEFKRQYAGRVESGEHSYNDPQMS